MLIMNKILVICTSILLLVSCEKDENPILNVSIKMTKSEVYQNAILSISSFSLFERGEQINQIGTSIIQQWDGVEINQDFGKNQNNIILIEPHWELELTGVKPDMNISVNENNQERNVQIDYIDYITLSETIQLQKNMEYEIIINIETDSAIQNINGALKLNWEFVSALVQ